MKLFIILFLVSLTLEAATFKERLDALFIEGKDPRTYIARCGEDPSHIKKAYRKILAEQKTTVLTCMEASAVDVADEYNKELARKATIKTELDWVKTINCSNISISTSKDRFLRFICYYFKRY